MNFLALHAHFIWDSLRTITLYLHFQIRKAAISFLLLCRDYNDLLPLYYIKHLVYVHTPPLNLAPIPTCQSPSSKRQRLQFQSSGPDV